MRTFTPTAGWFLTKVLWEKYGIFYEFHGGKLDTHMQKSKTVLISPNLQKQNR